MDSFHLSCRVGLGSSDLVLLITTGGVLLCLLLFLFRKAQNLKHFFLSPSMRASLRTSESSLLSSRSAPPLLGTSNLQFNQLAIMLRYTHVDLSSSLASRGSMLSIAQIKAELKGSDGKRDRTTITHISPSFVETSSSSSKLSFPSGHEPSKVRLSAEQITPLQQALEREGVDSAISLLRLWHGAKYASLDAREILHLIEHFGKARNPHGARRSWELMERLHIPCDVHLLNKLLSVYRDAGDAAGCQQMLMPGCKLSFLPNALSFTIAMSAQATPAKCEELLLRMRDLDIAPDTSSFNVLMKKYAQARDPEGCEAVLHRMKEFGVRPDIDTFNFMVVAQQSVDWRENVLGRLENYGVRPDLKIFEALMAANAKAGSIQGCEAVIDRITKAGLYPGANVFNLMMTAQATNEWRESIFARMEQRPHCKPNVRTYHALMEAQARVGNLRGCEELLSRMTRAGVKPDATIFNLMIMASNSAETREVVFERLREHGIAPDVHTFHSLMDAHALSGSAEGCEAILARMKDANVHPTATTFNTMMLAHKSIDWREQCFSLMQQHGIAPSVHTFNLLLDVYADIGSAEGCESVLSRIAHCGLHPNAATFDSMMSAFPTVTWRQQLLNRMQGLGVAPNVHTFNSLMEAQSKSGPAESCMTILNRMTDAGIIANMATFMWMMTAKSTVEWREEVLALMSSRGIEPDVHMLNLLMEAAAKAGSILECEAVLERMHRSQITPNVATYNLMSQAQASSKFREQVLLRLQEQGFQPDARTFSSLMDAYAQEESEDGIRSVLTRMARAGFRPDAINYGAKSKLQSH